VLRRDSGVDEGPPWPVTASEVMGGRRSCWGYSGGPSCTDQRRRQWSSRRLQCQSRGNGRRGRAGSVALVRGRGGLVQHPNSCTGAAETGAARVVSDAVWEQGSRQRTWAAHELMDRPGKKRAGSGPREQCRLGFKTNCQNEHNLIRSKTGFILIKKIK
jgi:hypothetical protein